MSEIYDVMAEQYSKQCRCGQAKKPGASFCPSCTNDLPFTLRNNLRKTYGYLQAYDAAARHLFPEVYR